MEEEQSEDVKKAQAIEDEREKVTKPTKARVSSYSLCPLEWVTVAAAFMRLAYF